MPPPDIKPDFLVSLKSLSVYVLVAANMDKLLFADNNVPLLLNVLPSACVSLKKLRVVVFFLDKFFLGATGRTGQALQTCGQPFTLKNQWKKVGRNAVLKLKKIKKHDVVTIFYRVLLNQNQNHQP
jgi:hypothetical protein